jgi:PAP2 superfamily
MAAIPLIGNTPATPMREGELAAPSGSTARRSVIAMNRALRAHSGLAELATAVGLYAVYELVRGFGSTSLAAARAHTAAIVALEQSLGVFGERGVQRAVDTLPGVPALLGFAYMSLHLGATTAVLIWVYRSHRAQFALVRSSIVIATAISLVIYVLYPAAPPRLAGIGFADTVTDKSGINLSSESLGSLYNPFAAVPSLHFGYALIVGAAVYALARRRWVRWIGAAYPPAMLFIIVATGNHFLFDAAAGGVVVIASWIAARALLTPRRAPARLDPALAC